MRKIKTKTFSKKEKPGDRIDEMIAVLVRTMWGERGFSKSQHSVSFYKWNIWLRELVFIVGLIFALNGLRWIELNLKEQRLQGSIREDYSALVFSGIKFSLANGFMPEVSKYLKLGGIVLG